jgi:hypothetical protein
MPPRFQKKYRYLVSSRSQKTVKPQQTLIKITKNSRKTLKKALLNSQNTLQKPHIKTQKKTKKKFRSSTTKFLEIV